MLTGVAEGYWHIRGGPFSHGLPQGALFTQILCNNNLFLLCALSDISACLTRTVETETTRISIGCHSIRMALVVRWHHIRAILGRYNFWRSSLGTSWSWATKLEPALLVPPGGSADPNWVVMKLEGYLFLGYTTILQGVEGSPFCPRHILRCVHSQNSEIQALQWVLKNRRRTLPVLWLRFGS